MNKEFERRQTYSKVKLEKVRENLAEAIGEALPELKDKPKFSVYATGSFGRFEASQNSDLDTFIVGAPTREDEGNELSGLDQKILIGRIIEVVRKSDLPDLDRDGEFIKYFTSEDLVKNIGQTEDETQNTFTARLLLLLESKPLLYSHDHDAVLEYVINVYWRDFNDYPEAFRPTFLLNDILKYWRLLCVDYEAKMTRDHSDWEERKETRRVKNLKLRYNRMMTCFSTVAAMCDQFARDHSVSPDQALKICKSSPIERLRKISNASDSECVRDKVAELEAAYSDFLRLSAQGKGELIKDLKADEKFAAQRAKADSFGRSFFELISLRSSNTELFRYLVV